MSYKKLHERTAAVAENKDDNCNYSINADVLHLTL